MFSYIIKFQKAYKQQPYDGDDNFWDNALLILWRHCLGFEHRTNTSTKNWNSRL